MSGTRLSRSKTANPERGFITQTLQRLASSAISRLNAPCIMTQIPSKHFDSCISSAEAGNDTAPVSSSAVPPLPCTQTVPVL